MPWDKVGKHRYFRTHRRKGKKRIVVYFGRGPLAEVICVTLANLHEKRLQIWKQQRDEKAAWNALQVRINALRKCSRDLQAVALLAAGYVSYYRTWKIPPTKRKSS